MAFYQYKAVSPGGEVQGSSPAEMRALVQAQIAKWADVIKAANIPRL